MTLLRKSIGEVSGKTIVFLLDWHSDKMGYSDNFLPHAVAKFGWNVHIVTSTREVFYNRRNRKWYKENLKKFLGNGKKKTSTYKSGRVTVHRLRSVDIFGFIFLLGFTGIIRRINPQVIQSGEYWTGPTFQASIKRKSFGFLLTSECHVHNSVFSTEKWKSRFFPIKRRFANFVARQVDLCFPISNESSFIASEYFFYPKSKLKVVPLGTDIELFKPAENKIAGRLNLGWNPDAFICVYTGKLIEAKGSHLLVEAVNLLNVKGHNVQAVIIGDGDGDYTKSLTTPCSAVIPFMPAKRLNTFYSICDLGVWPKQESTSQLDALACGLPVIISDRHGDIARSERSGSTYIEGDSADLANEIEIFLVNKNRYREHAFAARRKAETFYSWEIVARQYLEEIDRIMGKE